ncbi:MAG: thiamine-phosphate kinase [Nitrososphaeraceae archaeon]
MRESREQQIINILSSELRLHKQPFPLDDVALIDLGRTKRPRLLAFKCDMLIGSTDIPPFMKSWQVARKSIVSCVSDFAAKGLTPSVCILSLGLPRSISLYTIKELTYGFRMASREFGINIIGGDTNHSNEFTIDCSMFGHSNLPISAIPAQSGAKPGDVIVTSGVFGQTAAGLKIALNNAMVKKQIKARYMSSVMLPKPRVKFGISLRKFLSSSIDSSDGLASSLCRLAIKSKVDFNVEWIPIAPGIDEFASKNGILSKKLVMYGGEEFEIVGTIPLGRLSRARQIATSKGLRLIEIGKVSSGTGKVFLTGKGGIPEELENRGYSDL